MLASSNVAPDIQGLDGHSPSCRVTSGALPRGMVIDGRTCAVTGSPLESGNFDAKVTLTAAGTSGSVTANVGVTVTAAYIDYPEFTYGATWGFPQSFAPAIKGYAAQAGDTVTYALAPDQSLDHDNLRSYFTLDPTTGYFTGTFTGGPSYSVTGAPVNVVATIVRAGNSMMARGFLEVPATTPHVYYLVTGRLNTGSPTTYPVSAPPFAALGYSVTYRLEGNSGSTHATIDASTGTLTINNNVSGNVQVRWTATKGNQVFTDFTIVSVTAG